MNNQLPLTSMVRTLCRAAMGGAEQLYEVMIKLTLMIDATAQTYGLATWTQSLGERPRLKWAEGLEPDEIANAEAIVADALQLEKGTHDFNPGDRHICMVLDATGPDLDGAAIYGRCVHPITEHQARELRLLSDVAQLAHGYAALSRGRQTLAPAVVPNVSTATLPGVVSVSRAMSVLAAGVERIKDSDSTVLITGESGTGKELLARAVHSLGRRSQKQFVPFNCTAAPPDLIESMLFGHRKGAFTGAHADNEGLVRTAEGGTLFLDEIGDLPLALQPKLLRFLQEGEIHTLGERAPRKVNVRIVAATHKNLEDAIREGRFREDLYYRIASLTLHIPPLRERPDDAATLISHFLSHYARRNDRAIAGITSEAIRALKNYTWPGNVRELAAEMERLVLYADEGSYIGLEHLSARICPDQTSGTNDLLSEGSDLGHMLEDFERRVITETLMRNDCNVARAADALGLGSRQTLYKKLKRLAIDIGGFLQEDTEPGLQLRGERR